MAEKSGGLDKRFKVMKVYMGNKEIAGKKNSTKHVLQMIEQPTTSIYMK